MESTAEEVGSYSASYRRSGCSQIPARRRTSPQQLFQEIILVGGKILCMGYIRKSLQTYTGTDLVDVFQSLYIVAVQPQAEPRQETST